MQKYYQVWISAENQEQADKILNTLLEKKLVTGGQFIKAPARFWWKGEIVDMDYVSITSFTTEDKKDAIIKVTNEVSVEEVPMIQFYQFESNEELTNWIDKTLKNTQH